MKFVVLMGSPRLKGTTAEICKPFINTLLSTENEVKYITLADKNITSCKGCYACQNLEDTYGCVFKDDMYEIVESIIWADYIILATPIYSWYCPTEMKVMLDRHLGLNKYYGTATKSLWSNKKVALIVTHGKETEYATTPFVMGIERLCEHSKLNYCGMYSVRNSEKNEFKNEDTIKEMVKGAKKFALELLTK